MQETASEEEVSDQTSMYSESASSAAELPGQGKSLQGQDEGPVASSIKDSGPSPVGDHKMKDQLPEASRTVPRAQSRPVKHQLPVAVMVAIIMMMTSVIMNIL